MWDDANPQLSRWLIVIFGGFFLFYTELPGIRLGLFLLEGNVDNNQYMGWGRMMARNYYTSLRNG
jgi:hypothetical protein